MNIARPSLAVYLMANEAAPELAEAAVRGGATVIELGIPYSDPLADGTTIQRAAQAALDAGITPTRALELLAEIHRRVNVPLVPMTYGAIVEGYGEEAFCRDAAAAGAEGLIVADIPPEESGRLRAAAEAVKIDLIHLVAPTSRPERIRAAASASRGFVYLVAAVGVTGARENLDSRVAELLTTTRAAAGDTPILGGFGVSTREHVAGLIAAGTDGAIVGSAAIDAIDTGGAEALEALVRDLAAGLTV
ncbi:MAG: tryptophan synthase subunit alpha [Thermoleophilia bacterium]|nr:tryptophan synthase subunit alpha [Thermoleophilia bacterium]